VYDSHGLWGYEGPYGPGDFSVLTGNPSCPAPMWNLTDNYEWTYTRFTYKDLGYSELMDFVQTLNSMNLTGSATKAYLTQMLDVNQFMAYYVLDGWAETWDHSIHNQELYKRLSDNKWAWLPWDADAMFGEAYGFKNSDIYLTETVVKNYFTSNFQAEINSTYQLLQASVLSVSSLNALMDEIVIEFNITEANASNAWAPWWQDFTSCESDIRAFFKRRENYVSQQVGYFSGDVSATMAVATCPQKPNVIRTYNVFTSEPGPTTAPIVLYDQPTHTVSVVWNSGNPQGFPINSYYLVYSTTPSGPFTTVPVTPASAGSGQLTVSVREQQSYYFSVISANALGNSTASGVTSILIPVNPPTATPTATPTVKAPTTPSSKTPSQTPAGTPTVVIPTNNTDSSLDTGSGSFWTLPVIIGIAVAGVVVVIIIIVVIVVVVAKTKGTEIV